ncbi:putative 6-phosphogluconolactonase [Erysiphe neolycopersici]|uniref:Putative 6-phosphogluconolactonase n=1 Tax=Erysiphe neolycopersici TaxID=212602 RepID=A0A420HQY6_9PEZI|nr:putative 6-phosphogluconolactonase [Erysiphe neolycopersici]
MIYKILLGIPLLNMVSAVNLYVASYGGNITSLSLGQSNGEYVLSTLSTVKSETPDPSWLEKSGDLLFLANENFPGPNGTIITYKTSETGILTPLQKPQTTPPGPVSIATNSGGSSVSTYEVNSDGSFSPLQSFFFKSPPGPHPQQETSHPHQAILDPTEKFIVVPDLGSDLIRVFSIEDSNRLTEQNSFSVPAGSGPRHGAFLRVGEYTSQKTYFFLISEITNTVASYAVSPADKSLEFTPISSNDVLNQAPPKGLASAELTVSPDKKFVYTSARNAPILSIPNPSGSKNDLVPSDTLQVWKIDPSSGALSFQQLAPAGGLNPRHFSLNKNGTLAAVALQGDQRVVIYERSTDSGKLGKLLASSQVEGQLSNVIWDD